MLVVPRVFVESRVCFDSSNCVLMLDEVGEFVRPSLRVVVFADRCLRVAVLAVVECPRGGASDGPWLLDCVVRLAGCVLVADHPGAPPESSISPLVAIFLVAGVRLVAIVVMLGGCPGGGGPSKDLRVFCCASRLLEWDSCVGVPCGSSGSS